MHSRLVPSFPVFALAGSSKYVCLGRRDLRFDSRLLLMKGQRVRELVSSNMRCRHTSSGYRHVVFALTVEASMAVALGAVAQIFLPGLLHPAMCAV